MTLSVWRKKTTGLKTKKRLLPLVLAAALCSSPVWAEEATFTAKEGANKRGNSSRLTQSFHFFMFEPIFSPVNALNQPI